MKRRQLTLAAAAWALGALANPAVAARHAAADKARPRAGHRAAPLAGGTYATHAGAMRFAAELAERRAWDLSWLQRQLGKARLLPAVQRLIMPPKVGTAKNWAAYRARFIEPARIQAGSAFWNTHSESLERAEAEHGVPADIVVGIIGVETFFGRIMGNFRVLDALATLSFDFPPGRSDRSAFFQEELEHLFELAQREGIPPELYEGSFAGALGYAQFMPGSVIRFAVDFDGDGHVDLRSSVADAIGSVAHYLAAHGWQRGMPTHHAVEPPGDAQALASLLAPDIVPSFSAAQMLGLGATLDAAGQAHAGALALVELHNGEAAPSYVAGTQNFYALTRYNWSSYYAMAVIELARAVRQARQQRDAALRRP